MATLGRGQRGTQIPPGRNGANGANAPGTLNGSSPTANLVSINIKGKWVVFHFPNSKVCWSAFVGLRWKSKHIVRAILVGPARRPCYTATGEPARLTSSARH